MLIDMMAPILETVEEILFEDSQIPLSVLTKIHPVVRTTVIGFKLAELVAEELATYTLQEGVVGALDLYTPEIRRYEETALVGMGGMRI